MRWLSGQRGAGQGERPDVQRRCGRYGLSFGRPHAPLRAPGHFIPPPPGVLRSCNNAVSSSLILKMVSPAAAISSSDAVARCRSARTASRFDSSAIRT